MDTNFMVGDYFVRRLTQHGPDRRERGRDEALLLIAGALGVSPVDPRIDLASHIGGFTGSLAQWVNAVLDGRERLCGIGPAKRRQLAAALDLGTLLAAEQLSLGPELTSPQDCSQFLQRHIGGRRREVFCCLFLDSRHRIVRCMDLFEGTLDGAAVYPREVVVSALHWDAAAVILAHNHPSGRVQPSGPDRAITERLRDALQLVDIRLLDHIIVGHGRSYSMAAEGDGGFA